MDKDILSDVIEAEKEIQKNLALEKAKSRAWLDRIRKEAEEEFAREEKSIRSSLLRSLEQAKRDAEGSASGIEQEAALQAERIGSLDDEALSKIVGRHLTSILPG